MRIIYLSYWSLSEGLTQSSVIPHIKVLAEKSYISEIYFLTIERANDPQTEFPEFPKIFYRPLYSQNLKIAVFNKFNDFRDFSVQIVNLIIKEKIDQVICRGALAGALGYLAYKKTKTEYIVESFEPHADYMLDGKIWSKWGIKYQMQKYWEKKIKKTAKAVVTVSRHFTKEIQNDCTGKVTQFGCAVDVDKFKFRLEDRISVRNKLGFKAYKIGIYVGKFGSIYYNEKAFKIFRRAFDLIPDFRLIVLTPEDSIIISKHLTQNGIRLSDCYVNRVPHHEVPAFLSASDFAFSMVRPSPVRLFCSPIKDGEYWANGLPILSADMIGEDSNIIKQEHVGAIFDDDLNNLEEAIRNIELLISDNRLDNNMTKAAVKHRSFHFLPELYDQLILDKVDFKS